MYVRYTTTETGPKILCMWGKGGQKDFTSSIVYVKTLLMDFITDFILCLVHCYEPNLDELNPLLCF